MAHHRSGGCLSPAHLFLRVSIPSQTNGHLLTLLFVQKVAIHRHLGVRDASGGTRKCQASSFDNNLGQHLAASVRT